MVVLFSGGIDSYIAWHYLGMPKTVYFDLNTPYSKKEIKVVKKLIPETIIEKVIDFSTRQEGENAYIPYRNIHLAMLANKYSDNIVIAGLKDDKVNDKNEKVFHELSSFMSDMMNRPILIHSPFWDMTKEQIVGWYLHRYRNSINNLMETISCYSSSKKNYCGRCPACFRKWCAFRANGIDDLPFHNIDLMLEYKKKAEEAYYIPERNETILRELRRYGI
jgi:7-cyano-7-deazaguanine synthase in queuosine biosynthesis